MGIAQFRVYFRACGNKGSFILSHYLYEVFGCICKFWNAFKGSSLFLLSLSLSFSLLPKDLQTSTSTSSIALTGLDHTPRFVQSAHHQYKQEFPSLSFKRSSCVVPESLMMNFGVFFLLAGSRDILLRRTDKMERPQLDRQFQCVHTLHAFFPLLPLFSLCLFYEISLMPEKTTCRSPGKT